MAKKTTRPNGDEQTSEVQGQPTTAGASAKRGRSPGYPGIDLERALELTQKLYTLERQHPAATETIFHHWELPATSSLGFIMLSALKKFRLLDTIDQGPQAGQMKVSSEALNIILDDRPDSSERQEALRRVAMNPKIHAELWEKYRGELPSDPNLRFHLIRERGFTERGAAEFIDEFKRTIAFAGLASGTTLPESTYDKVEGHEATTMSTPQPIEPHQISQPGRVQVPTQGAIREVPIPIQGSAWPLLRAAFPLTEDAWTQMIMVLNAMKPGLVEPKKEN